MPDIAGWLNSVL